MLYGIKIFNIHSNNFHKGAGLLWKGLSLEQVRSICNDFRSCGPQFFLGYVNEEDLNPHCERVKDDGRFDQMLKDLHIVKEKLT